MAPTSKGATVSNTEGKTISLAGQDDLDQQRLRYDQKTTPLSIVSDDESKNEHLSPQSRRRKKNRDQMRMARQKEREMMQRLRETMHRLEARYQETVDRGNSEVNMTVATRSHHGNAVGGAAAQGTTSGMVSSSQYAELIKEGARLKDENFRFRQALHEKNKFQETLERWHDDSHQPLTQEEVNMRHCGFEDLCTDDSCTQMTYEEVSSYIRDTHDRVAAVKQTISRRAALRRLDPTVRPLPPFLGWQLQYHREDDEMLFSFEKPFYHVTALSAMLHTWDNELTMQSYRKPVDIAMQSMTVFQVINDDTYVFRRRMRFQDQVVTTHYLRFRQRTNAGYAIGHCTVNRNPSQDGGQIWAANLSLLTNFDTAWSDLNQEYCVVRISGRMNVEATDFAASQAAVDIIFGLLRWENLNVGPVFTFTSS